MAPVNVLVHTPNLGTDLSYLDEFGAAIHVLDGNAAGADVDHLLGDAEVFIMGFPVRREVMARAPGLRWVHHTQAGVSNLHRSDVWGSDVLLTSSRGTVAATAIAEYAMAGVFHFARGLDTAFAQQRSGSFSRSGYRMSSLEGSTLAVIGLGGIGREVARLAVGAGMRAVATRHSITEPQFDVDGVAVVRPAADLRDVVADSDAVVICSQLTEQTRHFFDPTVFAAMKPGAILVNVARGEEIDEDALLDSLRSGHLRGALLDVYDGESSGKPPRPELLDTPGLILTPHVSGGGERAPGSGAKRLFVDNLHRYLEGRPLLNVVDRERGY